MRPDSPSVTACMVARGVLFVAGDPRWKHLVPPHAAEMTRTLLLSCSADEAQLLGALARPAFRGLVAFIEAMTVPGILLHYVLRKRLLEATVESAIREGFRQVVVLGAGLDTLALRRHWDYPDVHFIEVDHSATQRCKRAEMEGTEHGAALAAGPNLHLVAADLSCSRLPDILRADVGFDPALDTVFLAEGLLMYFPEWQVGPFLSGVYDTVQPAARCRLAFTFVEPGLDGVAYFARASRALRVWLRLRGEPFRWGIHRDILPAFLAGRGFVSREFVTPDVLHKRYLPGEAESSPVNGDIICVADRMPG